MLVKNWCRVPQKIIQDPYKGTQNGWPGKEGHQAMAKPPLCNLVVTKASSPHPVPQKGCWSLIGIEKPLLE